MTSLSSLMALLIATLYSAVPLILAAMGGVLSERSGVVNIALEGFMLIGAFVGIWGEVVAEHHGFHTLHASLIGILAVIAVGALLGLLHAFLTQRTKMDHVVSGLGINLLAAGVTHYAYLTLYPNGVEVQGLSRASFLYLTVPLPFFIFGLLYRTRFGLRLRASGESPENALLSGMKPMPIRYIAVTLSGVLGALGGAYLSMADAHSFSTDMSAGKGYVALAAVIFGKWNPLGAALGALFFGFFYALQTQLQISNIHLTFLGVDWSNPYILDTLPYLMTIAALLSVVGRIVPPASLGRTLDGN
jgi:ABC-type uncharacterized transport system permease subunit